MNSSVEQNKEDELLASLGGYVFKEDDRESDIPTTPARSKATLKVSPSGSSGRSKRPTSVRNGIIKGLHFERRQGLPPILGENPRVLILGSAPSQISLARGEYYANPHNHFWGVLGFAMNDADFPTLDYSSRCEVLKNRGIAVWDICDEFTRHKSADATLQCEEYSDIAQLVVSHPTIQRILCNGSASFNNLRKYKLMEKIQTLNPSTPIPDIIRLPSTSPAHAMANAVDSKGKIWKEKLQDLMTEP